MLQHLGALVVIANLATITSVNLYNVSSYDKENNTTLPMKKFLDKDIEFGDGDWFVAPSLLPISMAASNHFHSPRCKNHSRLFLHNLRNFTLWAVQMYDAAVKLPVGLLAGNQYQMGHYEECVGISVNTGEAHGGLLKGQYCLAEIRVECPIPSTADPYTMVYDPMTSAWNKIKYGNDPSKVRRDVIYWGLCVPDSCLHEEVNRVLQHELNKIADPYEATFTSSVDPKLCSTLETSKPLTVNAIAYLVILGTLIFLVVLSTWYDMAYEEVSGKQDELDKKTTPKIRSIFLAFSARRNLRSLFKTNPLLPAIDASHGPRNLLIFLMVFGHRLVLCIGHPVFNPEVEEAYFRTFKSILLSNGPIVVDAFFTVSGVMLSYIFLLNTKTEKRFNLAVPIIVRFIRLAPSYMMLLFFYICLMPYLGSGPFWESVIVREQRRCSENWWTNILFINNYVNAKDMCMFHTWYVAVDFQLFVISLIVLYCIWRRPRLGYTILGLLTTLSVIIPFVSIYTTHAAAILNPYPANLKDVRSTWYFQKIYAVTHNRSTPYFAGVIAGIILFKSRNSTYKLGKWPSQIAFFSFWGSGLGLILSGYIFCIPGRPYGTLEAAFYVSLHRLVFSAAIASLFMIMKFCELDFHQRYMSSKPFVVLSRLSYGAYLSHTMIQIYDQGILKLPCLFFEYHVFWMVVPDCIFAYTISLFLVLLIEAPFRSIEKIVFGKIR